MGEDDTELGSNAGTEGHRAAEPEVVPERVGRFVVRGVLGRGGMGIVLAAHDQGLDRELALKLLHGGTTPRHVERLSREAMALAQLSHPNVVQVYDVGQEDGRMFIAMELVRGQTLAQWQWEPRPWRECVEVYLQAGRGLAAAHAAQLVHRDFKPGNCILDEGGRVRVLDFGLVRDATEGTASKPARVPIIGPSRDSRSSLTEAGSVLGTFGYMSLEQFDGRQADERSDQFGFCASLYEALYGGRPFVGDTVGQLVRALMEERVQPTPAGSLVPRRVRRIVLRGLARQPSDRWPSMDALLRALERTLAPHRARWVAAPLGVGLVLGVGLWSWERPRGGCEPAQARLVGVWDEARKQEVKTAMLGTGLPYAAHTWARVEQRLDEHARAWAERHDHVCEAATARGERSTATADVDPAMVCLARSRGELREAVEVLAHATPMVMSNALALVDGLPKPARCDGLEALPSTMAAPANPRVAAEVEALGERLLRARSLEHAGELDAGVREADAIMAAAERLGQDPLVAEALLLRGRLQEQTGHYAEAQQDLERAYFLAVELGAREVEQGAASWLVRVVAVQQGRYDEGRQWGRTALAVAQREPVDREAEARVLSHSGTARWKEGELDEATLLHERAMAITTEVLGPAHPLLVDSLNALANVALFQGKLDEALAHQERALQLAEAVLGAGHPHVARSLLNMGIISMQQGKYALAEQQLQQALAIYEASFGPDHPMVGQTEGNLASVLEKQERREEALVHVRRAIAILERANGPDHPSLQTPLGRLAVLLGQQGRLGEAVQHQRRMVASAEASLPVGHPRISGAWNDLGAFLIKQGDVDPALELYRRSLAGYEGKLGPDHVNVSYPLVNIGKVLLARGDLDGADAAFGRALAVVERAWGPEHPRLSGPLTGLAGVALARGKQAEARAYAERAVSTLAATEATTVERADADAALAQALWDEPGERERALELARHARDVYAEARAWNQPELGQLEAWLAEHTAAREK